MGTVFSISVSVGAEPLTAVRTGVLVHGLAVDLRKVSVPPLAPTSVRTELLFLAPRNLRDGLRAVSAGLSIYTLNQVRGFSLIPHKVMSAAEGFHSVHVYTQRLRNSQIAHTCPAQLDNLPLFIVRHATSLSFPMIWSVFSARFLTDSR